MASKKRAITGLARPAGFSDEIGEAVLKGVKKSVKKKVSKATKDVVDPKYGKKVYNTKGGLTDDYKDYVMRNMKGRY